MTPLGPRFDAALVLANDLHRSQVRKGGTIPYVSHLLGVAGLVLEQGGDEDEAIAGLLHDAVEDQGGAPTLARIRAQFGDRVASIVDACSDTDVVPKPPWLERKEAYLAHLRTTDDPGVLRVSLADKLHNASSVVRDVEAGGDEVWGRFKADRSMQAWYYRELADIFSKRLPGPFAKALASVVERLETLAGVEGTGVR